MRKITIWRHPRLTRRSLWEFTSTDTCRDLYRLGPQRFVDRSSFAESWMLEKNWWIWKIGEDCKGVHPLNTNECHVTLDAWKMSFPLGNWSLFRVDNRSFSGVVMMNWSPFNNLVNFRPRIIWCGYLCHTDLRLSCYLLKYGCNCHWDLKKTGDPHGLFWILRPPQHGVNRASPFPRIVFPWLLSACSFRKFRWWPECLVPLYSRLKRFRWSHLVRVDGVTFRMGLMKFEDWKNLTNTTIQVWYIYLHLVDFCGKCR